MADVLLSTTKKVLGLNGPSKDVAAVNMDLRVKATAIRQSLQSLNHAQASSGNREALRSLGGAPGVAKLLETDAERGIELGTIQTRQDVFGENAVPSIPRKTFWELFLATFEDATLQILIVAAVVSLVIGLWEDPTAGYVEGCAILAAVLIVSVVTAANDYQKESQFRELSSVHSSNQDVVVVRGGLHWQIPVSEVVVGDIVCLEAGEEVPCDAVIVQSDGLQMDESALTGEPVDVFKDEDNDPFVLSGCTVEAGSCRCIAIAVGKNSQWGMIQAHLDQEQEQTPLQEKLDGMAAMIGYVGMTAAGATFIAMMFVKLVVKPDYLQHTSVVAYALEAFIIGVTIVVVAVPEGLPLAVTISLAFSTRKMLADQNLIRHLAACETMGNATNICSDKTGTLTENRMTVVKGMFADTRCDDTINRVPTLISKKALEYILEGISCCSTARVIAPETIREVEEKASVAHVHDDRPHIIGNKTEASLLLLAQSEWGFCDDTDRRREEAGFGKPHGSRLFPFSSTRKRMSVLVIKANKDGTKPTWALYHKGAAEVVLASCSSYLDIDGSEKKLTSDKRRKFQKLIAEFSSDALRCVALAHRSNAQTIVDPLTCTVEECERKLEKDMCLDGIAGIMDPLRSDVVEAVATCQRAGIFVRMVTGDNLNTANAIARRAGILKKGACAYVVPGR